MAMFNAAKRPEAGSDYNTASSNQDLRSEQLEQEFTNALTQNTVIEGTISTKDNVVFSGGLKGNIVSTKTVMINGGIIEGDVKTGEISFSNGKIRGNITSKGLTAVDVSSIVIGDIRAHDFTCDGKIKGDVYIEGTTNLGANAVVFGNIRSAEINIDPGAMIKGTVEVVRQSMVAGNLFQFEEEFLNIDDFVQSME